MHPYTRVNVYDIDGISRTHPDIHRLENPLVIVIGHRGASASAPENTMTSFRAALRAGADGIELDVRLTADGSLVVMHDDEVSRTTGASGRISELTLAQVRALDAAGAVRWPEPLPVPTIDEVLALDALLFIEVKGSLRASSYVSAVPAARAVAAAVSDRRHVVVSSFEPEAVLEVRRAASVPTALSILPGAPLDWSIDVASAAAHAELHVPDASVGAAFVARAHDAGLLVRVFTVNDPARARSLSDMGVDGIFTDDPAAMIAALREDG